MDSSFASDLSVNFKFGLAFALVLIVLICLLRRRRRRRGHLRCRALFFSFFFKFAEICAVTSLFLEVEDNYSENLPHFYYVQVLFYFYALSYTCDVATYDLLKKWKKTN
jgi:hypothetical protein